MATSQVEVTSADIARIAGVKPTAVSNWRRRHDDFPKPVGGTDRSPRFDLAQVESWLSRQGRAAAIPADQRLWQAFDSLRGALSPEDTLGVIGAILLRFCERPDLTVPVEPTALASELQRAAPGLVDLVGRLAKRDTARLVALATSAVDAARDAGQGPDGASQIFELLCGRFLDTTNRAGFTATPPQLADLMVRLAGAPASTLLDPACGSGTILLAAAACGYPSVRGQELDASLARLAALRLALRNVNAAPVTFDVRDGDSLRRPAHRSELVAAVVINPPFADRNWGHDDLAREGTWEYGVPARMESELAWVQRSLAQVGPGGAVVMLMPPGAAFRPSGRRVRRELLTRGALRAVVSLPPGLAAHYALALQIWILRRPDDDTTATNLLVLDATQDGGGAKTGSRGDPAQTWAQVHTLVTDAWQAYSADPGAFPERPGVARAISLADLLDEEVNVTPRRHLPLPAVASGADLAATREQFTRLVSAMSGSLPEPLSDLHYEPARTVTLNELAKSGAVFIRRPPHVGAARPTSDSPTTPTIEGRILIGADLVAGTPPSQVGEVDGDEVRNPPIRPGDILVPVVALRPSARVAVEEDAGAYPASTVYVVRVDPAVVDPWFLAGYLSSSDGARQAERLGSSLGGQLRVDLRRVRIPLPLIDAQRAYGQAFRQLAEFGRTLRAVHDLGLELARTSTDAIASSLLPSTEAGPSAP